MKDEDNKFKNFPVLLDVKAKPTKKSIKKWEARRKRILREIENEKESHNNNRR